MKNKRRFFKEKLARLGNIYFLYLFARDVLNKLRVFSVPTQVTPKDNQDLVKAARTNYNNAMRFDTNLFPDFGNRWGEFRRIMEQNISNFDNAVEVIKFAQTELGFDHRRGITLDGMHDIRIAEHLLRYEYPQFSGVIDTMSESPFSVWDTKLRIKRRDGTNVEVSNVHYFHMFYMLSMLNFDCNVESCCEIGGGYGNPARLWAMNPIKKLKYYCIVDMPESLFFAEVFLRASLPDAEVIYVTDSEFDFSKNNDGRTRVILCPIQYHAVTKKLPFDFLINTGSLAEMTQGWIKFWGEWADKQQAKYFYSHNYFGNSVDRIFEARSFFGPIMSRKWELKYVRPMHPLMMLQSDERKVAELIFVKKEAPDVATGQLFNFLEVLRNNRIGLYEYIIFMYSFLRDRNIKKEIVFVDKAVRDFGYSPVELIWVLQHIVDHEQFECLDELEKVRISNFKNDLWERFQNNYPKGTFCD